MEQRANIQFWFKLGKTFAETYELLKKVYSDNCMSRTQVTRGLHDLEMAMAIGEWFRSCMHWPIFVSSGVKGLISFINFTIKAMEQSKAITSLQPEGPSIWSPWFHTDREPQFYRIYAALEIF